MMAEQLEEPQLGLDEEADDQLARLWEWNDQLSGELESVKLELAEARVERDNARTEVQRLRLALANMEHNAVAVQQAAVVAPQQIREPVVPSKKGSCPRAKKELNEFWQVTRQSESKDSFIASWTIHDNLFEEHNLKPVRIGGGKHAPWSAVFVSPVTGRVFRSGQLVDPPEEAVPVLFRGTWLYKKKDEAEAAAIAAFLDAERGQRQNYRLFCVPPDEDDDDGEPPLGASKCRKYLAIVSQ
jgi:hypothetical protein